jgi:hypothetical protein
MKKLIALLIAIGFLLSFVQVNAEETQDTLNIETEQVLAETEQVLEVDENVGALPDQAGYGLKLGWEKIKLALTFNKEKKAELALKLAEKRMQEAKLMAKENKLEKMQKIKEEHQKLIQTAIKNIESSGETEDDLEKQIELESKIEEQETSSEDLEDFAISNKNMNKERLQEMLQLTKEFKEGNAQLKSKINENKQAITTRLKAKGVAEEKINERLAKIEDKNEKLAAHQIDQSEKMYNLALKLIEKAKTDKNVTIKQETLDLKAKAESKLNEAKKLLEDKKYSEAVDLARESKKYSALTIASIRGLNQETITKITSNVEELKKLKEEQKEVLEKIKEKRNELLDENKNLKKDLNQELKGKK